MSSATRRGSGIGTKLSKENRARACLFGFAGAAAAAVEASRYTFAPLSRARVEALAVSRRQPETATSDTLDAVLLWLDAATGAVRHEAPLPPLAGKPPWIGPLAVAGGRLWALAHPSNPADLRRSLWELIPKPGP